MRSVERFKIFRINTYDEDLEGFQDMMNRWIEENKIQPIDIIVRTPSDTIIVYTILYFETLQDPEDIAKGFGPLL